MRLAVVLDESSPHTSVRDYSPAAPMPRSNGMSGLRLVQAFADR